MQLLVFLNKECNQSVKEIVELNFNFERESDKIQESNYFFDNNILVKRKIKGKEDEVRGEFEINNSLFSLTKSPVCIFDLGPPVLPRILGVNRHSN